MSNNKLETVEDMMNNKLATIEEAKRILKSHGCTERSICEILSTEPFRIGGKVLDTTKEAVWAARAIIISEREDGLKGFEDCWGNYGKEGAVSMWAHTD